MLELFIRRPILSTVISVFITLLGILALTTLPITQFPDIVPPAVTVTARYTGANAEVLAKAVATPLERAINGVPGMEYITSVNTNDGITLINIVFKVGTDPDQAAVNVQNRVATVLDELPEEVIRAGVQTEKEVNSMLLYLNLTTSDSTQDEKFVYNFADINILPELKRIDGVGRAEIMGMKDYAMRIWLKPDRLAAYDLSPQDVTAAIRAQNVEAAPGKSGISSDRDPQALQYVLKYTGKFNKEENYENITLKALSDGSLLRLKDVADIQFDALEYSMVSMTDGKPSASIMIKQRPGSNAREVISNIKAKMEELQGSSFPPGMTFNVSYDVSRFLDASISEVLKTLIEAFILVFIVVFIFLQDFRSTLIPAIAVPVSLIGTLFFMQTFGFSINLLTLFALVLAIGIVVDNAIVVVEAVHVKMHDLKLNALDATIAAMKEIGGAIVAITLVMSAVFIPVSFLSGPVGIFYRQFSLTLAIAIVISGINALTLSPALCAMMLKPMHHAEEGKRSLLQKFFNGFNAKYERLVGKYAIVLKSIANRKAITYGSLVLFFGLTYGMLAVTPTGFIPNEDQGMIYVNVTTPPGATVDRTSEIMNQVQAALLPLEEVETVSTLAGYSLLTETAGATYGMGMINLTAWDEREKNVNELMADYAERTSHIKGASIQFLAPPPVPGFGNASGFELRLQDRSGGPLDNMALVNEEFIQALNDRPEIEGAFTNFDPTFPQFLLNVDHDKAAKLGISVDYAMETLQSYIGSYYASNFIRYGMMYKVMIQASPEYRTSPEALLQMYAKNKDGEMVPYSNFVSLERVYGPEQITRYNMFNSSLITGDAAPGYSSGDAINAVEEVALATLPRGFDIDWSGITREQIASGNQAVYIFLICLVFVYLLLAAQYESYMLPLPVILSLPAGIFGSYFFLNLVGLQNDIYAQVSQVMLIGLLGKNTILIIEIAIQNRAKGISILQSAINGGVERLRPILMTSFAFICGLIPLTIASGAGAIGNRTIGTAAAGGMLIGTIIGVFLIPGLYVVFETIDTKMKEKKAKRLQFNTQTQGVHQNKIALIAILGLILASGCKVNNVTTAESHIVLPEEYQGVDKDTTLSIAQISWENYFQDPRLKSLIGSALENNQDNLMTLERIKASRAVMNAARAGLLPAVSGMAGASQRKFGEYTMDGVGNLDSNLSSAVPEDKRIPDPYKDFIIGASFEWELDVWGKLTNRKKAAASRFMASEEMAKAVRTWLVSEVASNYYELLAIDAEIIVFHENIRLQEIGLRLISELKEGGRANQLAVDQFEALLLNSKAQLEAKFREQRTTEYGLFRLIGNLETPTNRIELDSAVERPRIREIGLPAQLLQYRPDVKEAEFQLLASRFDVNSAKATFFPSINLFGMAGFNAFDFSKLFFNPASTVFQIGAGLTAPIFNRRQIQTEFELAKADQRIAFLEYEKRILNAYLEVLDLVNQIQTLENQLKLKQNEVSVQQRSVENSNTLFSVGYANYLEVINAQSRALESAIELADLKASRLQANVQLYRALGGGWN